MEHDNDKAVSIEVFETIMGGMVKEFGANLELCSAFFFYGIIKGKEYGKVLQRRRDTAPSMPGSHSYPPEVVKSIITQYIVSTYL